MAELEDAIDAGMERAGNVFAVIFLIALLGAAIYLATHPRQIVLTPLTAQERAQGKFFADRSGAPATLVMPDGSAQKLEVVAGQLLKQVTTR